MKWGPRLTGFAGKYRNGWQWPGLPGIVWENAERNCVAIWNFLRPHDGEMGWPGLPGFAGENAERNRCDL